MSWYHKKSIEAVKLFFTAALKCHYDEIFDIHFFTFPNTIGLS